VLDLLYNLMLECTGRLQKCRLYAMSDNKAFRATVSYLIVRDLAHEKVFAKALESLGVNWDKTFPVPKTDSSKMPEVRELEKRNLHNQQWTFSNDKSGLAEIFNGESPFGDGELEALDGLPEGFDIPQMPEAPQEYSPGLDKELKQKAGV
jgi:Mn-containing catalase